MTHCPCGNETPYSNCCEPIISGKKPAETPEQLMRARYSAHVMVEIDFLIESIHPDHREGLGHKETKNWAENSEWYGLEIISTAGGGEKEKTGEVEFVVNFRDKQGRRSHHERAQFLRQRKKWFFTEGTMVKAAPAIAEKIGRNDPCPCGSGSKYKKCCG